MAGAAVQGQGAAGGLIAARPNSGFGRAARLLASQDFRAVLRGGRRLTTRYFQVYAMLNGRDCARLGLIVGSRAERRAVRRNWIKRRVREVFRGQRGELGSLDVVVQLRGGGGGRVASLVLIEELNGVFGILKKWRASSLD
ncbi:MAG TPA: ribonuclease P protein component [Burkholderiales bacterium]